MHSYFLYIRTTQAEKTSALIYIAYAYIKGVILDLKKAMLLFKALISNLVIFIHC